MRRTIGIVAVAMAGGALLWQWSTSAQVLPLEKIKLRPGFQIAVYATGVKNARQMALGANGTVFVGSRTAGSVYAIVDADKDHKADKVHTIATGLRMPSGIAFREGAPCRRDPSRPALRRSIATTCSSPGSPRESFNDNLTIQSAILIVDSIDSQPVRKLLNLAQGQRTPL